jgi:hypothetical protein
MPKRFSEAHRQALRATVQNFNAARTPADTRRNSQNPTKSGSRSSAVINATRYADGVIQALGQNDGKTQNFLKAPGPPVKQGH